MMATGKINTAAASDQIACAAIPGRVSVFVHGIGSRRRGRHDFRIRRLPTETRQIHPM
jgi:hypothetical protein